MNVNVVFFASLGEIVGSRELNLDVKEGAKVGDVLDQLEAKYPEFKAYRSILLTALNDDYVESSQTLAEGDQLAVFPPVSGGQLQSKHLTIRLPNQFYQITRDQIDSHEIACQLLRGEDGAICVFEGVVRNNSKGKVTRYLLYEAHESMALKKLREIGESVRQIWEIDSIGIVHRLGRMEIGETSVAVIVTSPHRRPAFDSCHYAIDRLKEIVPIWKKEFFEDGEIWV